MMADAEYRKLFVEEVVWVCACEACVCHYAAQGNVARRDGYLRTDDAVI